jgi:adhesin/invasin
VIIEVNMKPFSSLLRRVVLVPLVLALAGCGDKSPSRPEGTTPAGVRVVSGDGQTGAAGATLEKDVVVEVVDDRGRPVPGVLVRFRVLDGEGSVAASPLTQDEPAMARARWTLGPVAPDSQVLEAWLEGVQANPVRLVAFSVPGPPAQLSRVRGATAGLVGGAVTPAPAVRVADRFGNGVPGVEVGWEMVAGDGTLSPARGQTDSTGVAAVQWMLGPQVGAEQTVRAAAAGLPPVPFTAVAGTEGVPLQLARRGGDGQHAAVGTLLADSLRVALRMPDGRPVAGAQVTWAAAAGGVTPAVSRTDAQGYAAAAWRLGTVAGLSTATATVDGGTLTFTARGDAGPPAQLSIAGGDGGTAPIGGAAPDDLAVRVEDAYGNPAPGAPVTWTVTSGGGSVQPAGGVDLPGITRARWILGPLLNSAQTVRASIAGGASATFTATAHARGVPLQITGHGIGQRGTPGSVLADSLVVAVSWSGRPVRGVRVQWTVPAGNGSVTQGAEETDAQGRLSAAWRLGTVAGPSSITATAEGGTLTFGADVVAGPPAQVAIVGGNGGTAPIGGTLPGDLQVRVSDAYGNPAPGAPVTWIVTSGGGSVQPADGADAPGVATARWTLGPRLDSVQTVRASIPGGASATFTATAHARGVPLQITGQGSGQRGPVGSVLADSLAVVVRWSGRPVQGARVQWTVPSSYQGSITPAEGRTDAQGRAAAAWRLGPGAGHAEATATVEETSLVFVATAQVGTAASLTPLGGSSREGQVGQPLADSLFVAAQDQYGNAVPGVTVTWGVASGGGSISPAQSVTDWRGVAVAQWTLGLVADSTQQASAVAPGVQRVFFNATARTQGVTLHLTRRAGNGQSGRVSTVLADSLEVEVRTPAGQPVRNAFIRWDTNVEYSGGISPNSSRTDANGRARTSWELGYMPGPVQATARLDDAVVTFTATANP